MELVRSPNASMLLVDPYANFVIQSALKASKVSFKQFPIEISYMPEVLKRLSLARQIGKVLRKESQDKADKSWFQRNAESIELIVNENDSEDKRVNKIWKKENLQAGISPLLQQQFEELTKQNFADFANQGDTKKRKMVVIGQDCVEPFQALKSSGQEVLLENQHPSLFQYVLDVSNIVKNMFWMFRIL